MLGRDDAVQGRHRRRRRGDPARATSTARPTSSSTTPSSTCTRRGEPADAVTVSAELTRAGQLVRAGGAPYLHTLINLVPTAANAGYYAQIVAERATLRRLVTAGTRIVQMGYDTASGAANIVGSVDDVVDRAQAEIYDVTERRTSEDYVHIESLLQTTLDEIEKISATGGVGTGIPTGFPQLDEITNGLHPGQMITVAGRPGSGKSTLALDFARSAAVKNGKPTVIFSLEMGKLEIMMRLFSAEAGVALQNMRSGHMSDQDWARLARRASELAEAPLFIDDSPNLTMMEIRAKARRLRQRHDLQLIVIDYLQLMTSGKRVESRQQEVSEFSRAMKLLAKELDVPVVALSPAQPRSRAAHRQEADAGRPARVRLDRAGLRHGAARAPARPLRARDRARRRGRPDHRQAPQRPDRHGRRRLPGPLQPLRRHA